MTPCWFQCLGMPGFSMLHGKWFLGKLCRACRCLTLTFWTLPPRIWLALSRHWWERYSLGLHEPGCSGALWHDKRWAMFSVWSSWHQPTLVGLPSICERASHHGVLARSSQSWYPSSCSHLLPARSPYAAAWKKALLLLPDSTRCLISRPAGGVQYVFTDGTATAATSPAKIAAWGSLNATSGEVVAMRHVLGLTQSSDRAELLVALGAIELQVHFGINMHLRRDSKFVANGLSFILQSGATGEWSNQDLWERIHQLLQQLGQFELVPHWIPSHLDATKLQDPFEDWVRCWNDQIDFAVGQYNFCRAHEFFNLEMTRTNTLRWELQDYGNCRRSTSRWRPIGLKNRVNHLSEAKFHCLVLLMSCSHLSAICTILKPVT